MHRDRTPKPAYARVPGRDGQRVSPTTDRRSRAAWSSPSPGRRGRGRTRTAGITPLAPRRHASRAFDGAPYLGLAGACPAGSRAGRRSTRRRRGRICVLDGFGGVHKFGTARSWHDRRRAAPATSAGTSRRPIAITPNGRGLHRARRLRRVAQRRRAAPACRARRTGPGGTSRARSRTHRRAHGAYMLDGFGGVHVGGDAVARRGAGTGAAGTSPVTWRSRPTTAGTRWSTASAACHRRRQCAGGRLEPCAWRELATTPAAWRWSAAGTSSRG